MPNIRSLSTAAAASGLSAGGLSAGGSSAVGRGRPTALLPPRSYGKTEAAAAAAAVDRLLMMGIGMPETC